MQTVLLAENHSMPVVGVAFARGDSEQFGTCAEDGTIRIWDAGAYTVRAKAFVRGSTPTCLAFTDEIIMSGWSDGKIRAFDVATGEPLWSIKDAHPGGVTCIALSPNYVRRKR